MPLVLQYGAWAIGLWLNLRVISALVRGSYREYPFVFAYALSLLASTVIEIGLQAAPQTVRDGYYWIDERILDVLVFCVVIAFIDEAARYSKQKTIKRRWLILAAALIFAVSYTIHRSSHLNRQMTLISRDLNICALMLLSGGLGLQLTGAIMGEQLRNLSRSLRPEGIFLEVVSGFLGLYIWWRALRTQTARARSLA